MPSEAPIIIIGTGPTALGAAYRLKELGVNNFMLLERNDHVGGLAYTFTDPAGFLWDIGGHVQFSHYRYFDEVMKKAVPKWLQHSRQSYVLKYGEYVPYPFQNNIHFLPEAAQQRCLDGLRGRNGNEAEPSNFKDWILQTFGQGIADEFMLPYNFKVWAHPPETMAYQWIGERVPVVTLEEVLANMERGISDESWGPNATFAFPEKGGTGAIWKEVAEMVGPDFIRLSSEVTSIDVERKTLTTTRREVLDYSALFSTVPLPKLGSLMGSAGDFIHQAASGLVYSSTHVVGIGLKGSPPAHLAKKNWMYFPENNSPYYRVTVFSNYSPYNTPEGNYWSLMTETSESENKPVNHEALISETIGALLEDGLIPDESAIVSRFHHFEPYGYPTPGLERDRSLASIIPQLEKLNIFSRGRFGGWKYEVSNQDHSFMQGVEWANRWIKEEPETTFFHPNIANSNQFK